MTYGYNGKKGVQNQTFHVCLSQLLHELAELVLLYHLLQQNSKGLLSHFAVIIPELLPYLKYRQHYWICPIPTLKVLLCFQICIMSISWFKNCYISASVFDFTENFDNVYLCMLFSAITPWIALHIITNLVLYNVLKIWLYIQYLHFFRKMSWTHETSGNLPFCNASKAINKKRLAPS